MLCINGFISTSSTNLGIFFNLKRVFKILAENRKIFKRIAKIDQHAMCYISIDSSRQALQTYEKLFSKFEFHFRIIGRKPKNIHTA